MPSQNLFIPPSSQCANTNAKHCHELSLKYFVQENYFCFVLWILKYFENFLVKNLCTKCSWLNLRFIDWHLYCSIALSVSLDFCDKEVQFDNLWLTHELIDWLINYLLGLVDWKQLQFLFNLFILSYFLQLKLTCIDWFDWILWTWLWFLLELLNFICIWKLCWN